MDENVIPFLEKYIVPYVKRFLLMAYNNKWYILWFLFYYYFSLKIISAFVLDNAWLITLLLYGVSIGVAYIAGGEIIGALEGARPVETKQEKEYLIPIFLEVYQDVKRVYPAMPSTLKLCIIDNLTVNGIALGKNTIAVTQGAIETLSPEELKGIIAHEMSHIYYGDTIVSMLNMIGNGIFSIIVIIMKLVFKVMEFVAKRYDSSIIQAVFVLIRLILELWVFCLLWVGKILLSFNSRGSELRADKFAYETGYGEKLINALYLIQKLSLGQKMKLVDKMLASHPRVSKRIAKLEMLVDEEAEI